MHVSWDKPKSDVVQEIRAMSSQSEVGFARRSTELRERCQVTEYQIKATSKETDSEAFKALL